MNTAVVAGVPLESLRKPIREGLQAYSKASDGRFVFNLRPASSLTPTPERPNSARNNNPATVWYLGKRIGELTVIFFAPGDGTGDRSTYTLDGEVTDRNLPQIKTLAGYPHAGKLIPRSKFKPEQRDGVHTEVHLALGSLPVGKEAETFGPEAFRPLAGHLDLIGVSDERRGVGLVRIGTLGQPLDEYRRIMRGETTGQSTATLTTGFSETGDRYGDPHAVYNNETMGFGQVAGFIALTRQFVGENPDYVNLFKDLGAAPPRREF